MKPQKLLTITEKGREFLRLACQIASENIDRGGGPFGAVIVKDDQIIATGGNTVTLDNDPTAHAEINAIRRACQSVQSFQLEDCVIYSSCEPCPMCLSALYWAGVSCIFYANSREDAQAIDFDDNFIYQEIPLPHNRRKIPCIHVDEPMAIEHFRKWAEKADKVEY